MRASLLRQDKVATHHPLLWGRIISKLCLIILSSLICILLGLPWLLIGRAVPAWLSLLWHRNALKILNITVRCYGKKLHDQDVGVFCSNHLSYLDIMVLGSQIGGRFVSRADVRNWAIIRHLAKWQGTIFIERKRAQATKHISIIRQALQKKKPLIIFAEGTSTAGVNVLPIKSTLLEPLIHSEHRLIQPITIYYKHHYGLPMGRLYEPLCAWYGDMEMAPHLLEFLSLGPIEVALYFHPPSNMFAQHGDRKKLAHYLHHTIAQGLVAIRHGRISDETS